MMPQDLSPHSAGVSCLCKTLPKLTPTPKIDRLLLQGKTLQLIALITPIKGKNNFMSQLILALSLAEMAAAEVPGHRDSSNINMARESSPAASERQRAPNVSHAKIIKSARAAEVLPKLGCLGPSSCKPRH